jgi:hypothetical protein
VSYRSLFAVPLLLALAAQPARAVTDWSVVAATWKEQLADLYVADAARRLCGMAVSAPVESSLRTTIRGLEQALGTGRKAERAAERGLVASAGGPRKFCADAAMMAKAKATQQSLQASVLATGGNVTLPYQPPQQAALSPTMTTPVIDPDIALIRGCRKAAIARTGSRRVDSNAFWTQYERCIGDQGAGWY